MAGTVSLTGDWQMNPGDRVATRATFTFDALYPTGGESLTPAMLGLGVIDFLVATSVGGYVFEYNYTTKKLLAYWVDTTVDGAPLAEVADTTDLALIAVPVYAIGRP